MAVAPHTKPAGEIRTLRFAIAVMLVVATLWTLDRLLDREILEKNKLEVGLLLGWLIAKSGTVIDWLFGGSESGGRRSDALTQKAVEPIDGVPKDAAEAARQTADAADDKAEQIERKAS